MSKIRYLISSMQNYPFSKRWDCPNCGHEHSSFVARKYVVTELRRCLSCLMLFRAPTDEPHNNAKFYDEKYTQGFTTQMPTEQELERLKLTRFSGTEKDYGYYLNVLHSLRLKEGATLLDYGCSWGYGSYQLAAAGYNVVAFEVALRRRSYARDKLGIKVIEDLDGFAGGLGHEAFDCFFSAHVLEHVPSPRRSVAYAWSLLKVGGLFVAFVPNGSDACRRAHENWNNLWGKAHPNFIDDAFLDKMFTNSPRVIATSPVHCPQLPPEPRLDRCDNLEGVELFFAAMKTGPSP